MIAIGNGIGSGALTTANSNDNTIILGHQNGHSFSPNVGIGTYKPDSKVHIVTNGPNAIKIQDTNQGVGKVLTSDANGVGTWKEPAPPIADFTKTNMLVQQLIMTCNQLRLNQYLESMIL